MGQNLKSLVCLVCGGEVVVDEKKKIATCRYCGQTYQISNSLSDNGLINLSLANEYYKTFRFDDAKRKYLEIAEEDETFVEAHWGALISEYGIEWCENNFGDIVPTCHRAHIASVYDNVNYQNVIKYASEESKQKYIELAGKIEDVREQIISKSQSESDYDVFICFKATEEIGGRKRKTVDYDLGNEIYKKLTDIGYKVFFSPETLLRIAEQEFESYIFKALNTAKVMLLLCGDNVKIESPWVKNEWGRFFDMHNGNGLIPLCGNRFESYDPASLPSELRKLNCIEYGVNLYDQLLTKIETYFPEKIKGKEEAEKQKMYEMLCKIQEDSQKQLEETKKSQEQQKEIEELKGQIQLLSRDNLDVAYSVDSSDCGVGHKNFNMAIEELISFCINDVYTNIKGKRVKFGLFHTKSHYNHTISKINMQKNIDILNNVLNSFDENSPFAKGFSESEWTRFFNNKKCDILDYVITTTSLLFKNYEESLFKFICNHYVFNKYSNDGSDLILGYGFDKPDMPYDIHGYETETEAKKIVEKFIKRYPKCKMKDLPYGFYWEIWR